MSQYLGTLGYIDIFYWKVREAFALQMLLSFFFNKKYWGILDINIWNFNRTLTNDILNFEHTGPVCFKNKIAELLCLKKYPFTLNTYDFIFLWQGPWDLGLKTNLSSFKITRLSEPCQSHKNLNVKTLTFCRCHWCRGVVQQLFCTFVQAR